MLGRTPADIEGQSIVDIKGDEGFATIRPYVEQVLAGSRVEYQSDVTFAGVGLRSLRVIYIPDRDGSGQVIGRRSVSLKTSLRMCWSLISGCPRLRVIVFTPCVD
jgi:hypothetical protein